MSDNFSILAQSASKTAPLLLGSLLVREHYGKKLIVRIVETEAYDQEDAASHSYRGETARTKVMFGPPGFAYIYFTYGMHFCMNVVVGEPGHGSAVLIRAVEPIKGIKQMKTNRQIDDVCNLTNGPAKLCQALLINKKFYGHNLRKLPLKLSIKPALPASQIVTTTRVGISHDSHRKWRFYIKDNSWVSRH